MADGDARFLGGLGAALRAIPDPGEVQAVAARMIARHFGVARAHWGEADGEAIVVAHGYGHGLAPMAGRFPFEAFGAPTLAAYRAGRTVVVRDAFADPATPPQVVATIAASGFRAWIGAPIVEGGAWVTLLGVHAIDERDWTAREVATVEAAARLVRAVTVSRREVTCAVQ